MQFDELPTESRPQPRALGFLVGSAHLPELLEELAEEFGDAVFAPERGVVLVHGVRAEHIRRTLLGDGDALLEDMGPLPPRAGANVMRVPPPRPQPLVIEPRTTRWSDIRGWLGIVTGAAVFIAALALRGGRVVLDVDS